jgi:hypothetical protein
MTDSVKPIQFRRELAHRTACGLDVTLYWHPRTDALTVCVVDEQHEDYFEIAAAPSNALSVFYHPFLYADEVHLPAQAA